MSVTPVSSVVANSNSLLEPRVAKKTLDSEDFMKLLAVQFQSQDPMKPMDDTAFIAQTAQFSSLQQTTSLVQQMTQLAAAQNLSAANSYLGRQVTVDLGQGQTDVGNVSGVDARNSAPMIIVNGQAYPLSAVLFVQPGAPSTPAP